MCLFSSFSLQSQEQLQQDIGECQPSSHVCVHAQLLQLCPTLCNPTDRSPPGSSVHGILQVRMLEWLAMPSSRESSPPRDWTRVSCLSCTAGGFFTTEPLGKPPHPTRRNCSKAELDPTSLASSHFIWKQRTGARVSIGLYPTQFLMIFKLNCFFLHHSVFQFSQLISQ